MLSELLDKLKVFQPVTSEGKLLPYLMHHDGKSGAETLDVDFTGVGVLEVGFVSAAVEKEGWRLDVKNTAGHNLANNHLYWKRTKRKARVE